MRPRWKGLAAGLAVLGLLSSAEVLSAASGEDPEAAYARLSEDGAQARNPAAWSKVGASLSRRSSAESVYRAALCFERAFSLSDKAGERERAAALYDEVSTRFSASSVADDALLRAGGVYRQVFEGQIRT